MPLDPQIPLMVQPPSVQSPIANIGQFMALRGQQSEIALRNAQTQNIMAQEQDRQRKLQAESTIQEMMRDPVVGPKIASGDLSPLNGKIPLDVQSGLQTTLIKAHQEQAALDTTTLTNRQKALDQMADTLYGVQHAAEQIDDPQEKVAKVNELLPGAIQQLNSSGVFRLAQIDPTKVPTSIQDVKQLADAEASIGVSKAITDKALEIKGKTVEQATKEAAAKKDIAQATQADTENAIKQIQLGYMRGAGASGSDDARHILFAGHPDAEAAAKAMGQLVLTRTGDPKLAAEAEQKVYTEQVAPFTQSVIQGAGKKAATVAQAEIPAKTQTAIAVEKAKIPLEMGMRQQNSGSTEYEKSLATLSGAAADASRIHNLIQAAQGGNKAAPAIIPLAELRQYVNRVNQTELRSVGGAGSLVDKVEGWITGKTEGQPIPPDILKATDDLAALQLNSAEQKHQGEVKGINTARGTNFAPKKATDLGFSPLSSGASGGGGAQYKKGDRVMYQGREHTVNDIVNGKLVLSP